MSDEAEYSITFTEQPSFDVQDNARIVPHITANPAGDWVGLSAGLKLMLQTFPRAEQYRLLEIGCAHGHAGRNMWNYVEAHTPGRVFAWGVDSTLHKYCPCQFGERMLFVEGNSLHKSTVDQFKDEDMHFVFIDACHCEAHTYNDIVNYAPKVKPGGFLAFHDTSPRFQGGSEQPFTPECSEDRTIGVVKAIEKFDLINNGFKLVLEEYHTDSKHYWGGVRVYQKIIPLTQSTNNDLFDEM